jgi:lysyl-tRNA synthetase, class II
VVPDLPVPTFVKDFPVDTSPLTRQHRRTAGLVEKWDLYIRSVESATAYSELVDPVVQRERFEAQVALTAAGDDEAMPLDEDFLTAMEYGMPPSGGMGMGIDGCSCAHRFGYPRDHPVSAGTATMSGPRGVLISQSCRK